MITIKQIFNNLPSSVEELCTILAQATTRPEKEEAGPKEERKKSKREKKKEQKIRERERDNRKNPEQEKKPVGDHDEKEQRTNKTSLTASQNRATWFIFVILIRIKYKLLVNIHKIITLH
jgi:hypothetical protein